MIEAPAEQGVKEPGEGTIAKQVQAAAAPIVTQVANTVSAEVIKRQVDEIDEKYGPGTWKAVFADKLEPVFENARRTDPTQLMNPAAIANAVSAVKGQEFDTLVERQAEYINTRAQVEADRVANLTDQVVSNTNLSGGLRLTVPGRSRELDEHADTYLSTVLKETGELRDKSALKIALNSGNDYESWQRANAAAAKEA